MLQNAETARRWLGERLPNDVLAGSANNSEDNLQAIQAQRLVERFRISTAHADVVARLHFGEARS